MRRASSRSYCTRATARGFGSSLAHRASRTSAGRAGAQQAHRGSAVNSRHSRQMGLDRHCPTARPELLQAGQEGDSRHSGTAAQQAQRGSTVTAAGHVLWQLHACMPQCKPLVAPATHRGGALAPAWQRPEAARLPPGAGRSHTAQPTPGNDNTAFSALRTCGVASPQRLLVHCCLGEFGRGAPLEPAAVAAAAAVVATGSGEV